MPENILEYPRLKKIPENTRSYISTLLPDPNPTRYPVFFPIPDPTLKNCTRWALAGGGSNCYLGNAQIEAAYISVERP